MHHLYTTLFILICTTCFSQNTIKVDFENTIIVGKDDVKDVPKAVQEMILKQLKASIGVSTMSIDKVQVFYEIKSQTQEKTVKGNGKAEIVNGKVSTLQELNSSIKSPSKKFIKNTAKNTYTEKIEGKIVTKTLSKTNWKITNKTKKILGYSCQEAIGTYNNKPITIYFTKELKAKASPELLPLIDGVVLEYNTGRKKGIAVKIEKNQPDVKDFFKN